MPFSLGVIGLGRMAQAFVIPLIEKGDVRPDQILGVVGQKQSVKDVIDKLPKGITVVASDDPAALDVWNVPVQLLAVKPQQLASVEAQAVNSSLHSLSFRPLLISLLAGVTLDRLQTSFSKHSCVRAIPNTPVLVGAGLTGLAWSELVTSEQKNVTRGMFQSLSELVELPESQMDAFLGLTSSGPAYVALILEALADGGVAAGLPRVLSAHLANRTLAGTAQLLKEKAIHPAELKDIVASPAGTTIAALRHLEKVGLRSSLIEAVVVAAGQSRKMG